MALHQMTYTESSLPQLCMEVGLDCVTCTSATARELAQACPGLPGKLVAQLFVQIHIHSACARMHRNFTQAYNAALDPATPKRMPVGSAPSRKECPGARAAAVAA